jgi:serine/threonine protein kinase
MQRGFNQYQRQEHLFSTRTAEGFSVVSSGAKYLMWVQRFPFSLDSEESELFKKRISVFQELDVVPNIREYGLDSRGVAYLVFEPFDFINVSSISNSLEEKVENFIKILRVVSQLHQRGIVLGDLCGDSFVISRSSALLIGLMGVIESGAKKTAVLPSLETLEFLAPEQIGVGTISCASDVYALGIYGYKLFSKKSFKHDNRPLEFVSSSHIYSPSFYSKCPEWVDYVLGYALQLSSDSRFKDASGMLSTVLELMSNQAPDASRFWKKSDLQLESRRPTFVMDLEPEPTGFNAFLEEDYSKFAKSEALNIVENQERKEEFAPSSELEEDFLERLKEDYREIEIEPFSAVEERRKKGFFIWLLFLAVVGIGFCFKEKLVAKTPIPLKMALSGSGSIDLPVLRINPDLYQALEYARRSDSGEGASKSLVDNLRISGLDQLFLVVVQENDDAFLSAFEQYLSKRVTSNGLNHLDSLLKDWVMSFRQQVRSLGSEEVFRLDLALFLLQTVNPELDPNKVREMLEKSAIVDAKPTLDFVATVALDRGGEFAEFLCLKEASACKRLENGEVDVLSTIKNSLVLQEIQAKLKL